MTNRLISQTFVVIFLTLEVLIIQMLSVNPSLSLIRLQTEVKRMLENWTKIRDAEYRKW